MLIFTTAAELRAYAEQARGAGRRLGLVPTMGALHEGHLQLVRAAAHECDEVPTTCVFIRAFPNKMLLL
jgi:pantoate--beta-alanine ligase